MHGPSPTSNFDGGPLPPPPRSPPMSLYLSMYAFCGLSCMCRSVCLCLSLLYKSHFLFISVNVSLREPLSACLPITCFMAQYLVSCLFTGEVGIESSSKT